MSDPVGGDVSEGAAFEHRTVLLDEAIAALMPLRSDGVYVDGTFGRGGHSRLLLSKLAPGARLIAFDKDLQGIEKREGMFSKTV